MNNFGPQQRKRLEVKAFEKRTNFRPKIKRWSHQDDLDAAIGKRIEIWSMVDERWEGKLVAADQFTIKIDCKLTEESNPVYRTLFKHAIATYSIS